MDPSSDAAARFAPLPPPSGPARRERWAVSTIFFCNGACFASWVSRIPTVRENLALSEGQLGTALLAMAAGALIAFPLAGRATARLGARRVTLITALLFLLALPLPALIGSYGALLAVLFVFGGANGALDVSMNALAVEAETHYGRPIMSSFHGLFSVGGFAGAALGSAAAGLGLGGIGHLLAAAAVLCCVAWAAAPWLPRAPQAVGAPAAEGAGGASGGASAPRAAADPPRRGVLASLDRVMLGLGCMVFCAFLIEGAMADWSAVLLRDKLGTSVSQAALGYAAFSLTMTVMRLSGDHLVLRWGAAPLLRVFNLLGALAMAAALASAHVGATLLAFALCGLGVAIVGPTVFGAAARRVGQQAGRGIATMATFGYSGFLLGPPAIGWLAEATDLRLALGIVPVLTGVIVLLLPLLRSGPPPRAAAVESGPAAPRP